MFKRLSSLFFGLLTMGLLLILIGFGLLHTKYAKPLILVGFNQLSSIDFASEYVDYQYPNLLTFTNVVVELPDDSSVHADKLLLWFGIPLSVDKPIRIKELLLSGTTLKPLRWPHNEFRWWQIDNIALEHVDYSDDDWIINDLQLQLQKLELDDTFTPQQTEFQLQASQLYYQGESLTQLLVNGHYQPNQSVIYGASFMWNDAKISTQAQQENQTWSLVNATIEKLDYDFNSQWLRKVSTLKDTIGHINSLDILNSNLSYHNTKLINLNASVENLDLNRNILDQDNAYLSFDSDSLVWQDFQFVEPTLELSIDMGKIQLSDLDTNLEQGRIQASGEISNKAIRLQQLHLDGIKFIQEKPISLTSVIDPIWFKRIESISIDNLSIARGQWIQLYSTPHWQLTGVNIKSKNLIIKQNNRWGMWQGQLTASINSASYDQILANQLVIETESNNGLWQLKRLVVPLKDGFAQAKASLNFVAASQPLLAEVQALSLPVSLVNYLLINPNNDLLFSGKVDLTLNLDALIADELAFSKTATGQIRAQFHQTKIATNKQKNSAIDVSPLALSLQKGEITLEPIYLEGNRIKGQAGGTSSLTELEISPLTLNIQAACNKSYEVELLTGQVFSSPDEPCLLDNAGN